MRSKVIRTNTRRNQLTPVRNMVDTTFPCIVQSGFAANIVANRNDNLPRLVYADYLQELGYASVYAPHSMKHAGIVYRLWRGEISKWYYTQYKTVRVQFMLVSERINNNYGERVFIRRGFPYMVFCSGHCMSFHNIRQLCETHPTIERLYNSCKSCANKLPEIGFHNKGENQWIR